MHRIDTKNYVTDEQGRRLFTDGDPHKPAEEVSTWIDADWCNGLQESICRFIESKGIQLTKGDYQSLTEAIDKSIEQALTKRLEIYRNTINGIRDHIRDSSKPLPGEIRSENDGEDTNAA